jgi:sortase B
MKKINKKRVIIFILMIISLIGIIYNLKEILVWDKNTDSNNKIKEETHIEIDADAQVIEISTKNDEENIEELVLSKLDNLKIKNKDTVGYIKVNNSYIDYVVVQSNDNDYYLDRDFNKKKNVAGWIFADYRNKFDGSDKNIILYGHNMKDGSMFGTLHKTHEREWQSNEENLTIIFAHNNEIKKYKVFSTYEIEAEEYYIKTEFENDGEYLKFLKTLKSRSNYNYDIYLKTIDNILTLSSCTSTGNRRTVLHAVEIK